MNKIGRNMERQNGKVKAKNQTKITEVKIGDKLIGTLTTYFSREENAWKSSATLKHNNKIFTSDFYSDVAAETWILTGYQSLTKEKNKFGDWLSQELSANGLSQAALSDLLEVSRVTINNWCRNNGLPDVRHFVRIARIISDYSQKNLAEVLDKMAQTL